MLPDNDLNRLAASAIMQWPVVLSDDEDRKLITYPCLYETDEGFRLYRWPREDGEYYNPLNNWQHAGAIVDQMRADGFHASFDTWPGQTSANFFRGEQRGDCLDTVSTRAITIAALRALGVPIE